jgi:hypothetical protein
MVKRSAIFLHRWLGVALCLFFLLWFPSGIGMMYWEFPSVTADQRLERSTPLDAAAIRLLPAEAFAITGQTPPAAQVRLNTFDGRPVYRFRTGSFDTIVFADTGALQSGPVPDALAARVASRWVGQPAAAAAVETSEEADQWTVQSSFGAARPLRKYSWPNGEQVYVSVASGEVVQYTTTRTRIGAYLGPIPHWLYFTPLRKHQAAWSRVVIWSSALATIAAGLGIVIGVWMFSPLRRYRFDGAPARVPYRGQKRWHMVLGLLFGAGAATWAFSGLLSMDPWPSLDVRPRSDITQALRGRVQLAPFAGRSPREALAQLAGLDVKELELAAIAGEPVYLATAAGGETRIVPLAGPARSAFNADRIVNVLQNAAQPGGLVETRVIERYDAYYLDRRKERPLPVLLARVNDAGRTRYYIDPKTARVVGSYSADGWINRWLYHGLHSLDLPWLYDHRPLWDIVMIAFMLGGTALCVTSLVLAWRVLGSYLPG